MGFFLYAMVTIATDRRGEPPAGGEGAPWAT